MLASVFTGHFPELITLFVIVFVHELGHITAARWLGIHVISVQMLPFGGVAHMEDTVQLTAGREMVIALAGPVQNVLLICCSWLLHIAGLWTGPFYDYFIQGNILIALFNLLPVLPLDGGKLLQSLCSVILPFHATLVWSLRVSLLLSGLLIGYSLLPAMQPEGTIQLNLLLVGLFLLYSNYIDYRHIPYRFIRFLISREQSFTEFLLHGGVAQPIIADMAKPLEHILRLFKRGKYHFVYVMNQSGTIVNIVPEQTVIHSFLRGGPVA